MAFVFQRAVSLVIMRAHYDDNPEDQLTLWDIFCRRSGPTAQKNAGAEVVAEDIYKPSPLNAVPEHNPKREDTREKEKHKETAHRTRSARMTNEMSRLAASDELSDYEVLSRDEAGTSEDSALVRV
eukprot:GHVQ01028445.1.p1 GENE.GHVQ01028445.1~~GHVQ01028445.1.p1  ORF type:complete len:126 (-),score=17.76 GHVQ01028445.1:258-635(-)